MTKINIKKIPFSAMWIQGSSMMFLSNNRNILHKYHCVKTVRIRSFSGPHIPAFGLNTE